MSTWYFPVKLPSDEKQPHHQRLVLCLAAVRDLGSFNGAEQKNQRNKSEKKLADLFKVTTKTKIPLKLETCSCSRKQRRNR